MAVYLVTARMTTKWREGRTGDHIRRRLESVPSPWGSAGFGGVEMDEKTALVELWIDVS